MDRISLFLLGMQILGVLSQNKACLNGGTCSNLSPCTCECALGFYGDVCEKKLTRLDGFATYNISLINDGKNLTSIVDTDGFKSYLHTNTFPDSVEKWSEVKSSILNKEKVTFTFTVYMPTINITGFNHSLYNNDVTISLSKPELITASLGQLNNVTVEKVDSDIDECFSRLAGCHSNATCVDLHWSYACSCNIGYQGNGVTCKKVFCKYGNAPPAPTGSMTRVGTIDGKTLTDLEATDTVEYGTFIIYNCSSYYALTNSYTGEVFPQLIECVGDLQDGTYRESGWTGTDLKCAVSEGFKIAIVASVLSAVVIILVGTCLLMNSCVEKERKKKQKHTELREEEFEFPPY